MARWILEPGHSSAEFSARHMMVTWVRGHFKDVHGTLEFDPDDPLKSTVEVEIDAGKIWSGDRDPDAHLRSADFLDVENYQKITFKGSVTEQLGQNHYTVTGELTVRGVTRPVTLDVSNLGQWPTPYWSGDEDKGPITRAGFTATSRINRQEFGVSWNGTMNNGGVVVSNEVRITIDAEALLEADLERAGLAEA